MSFWTDRAVVLARRFAVVSLAGAFVGALSAAPLAAQRAHSASAASAAADPDANYRLSMAKIERLVPLAKNLSALQDDADVRAYLVAKKPEVARRKAAIEASGKDDDGATMAMVLDMLDGQPKIHQAFVSAGLTPRDYALTTLHLAVNWMAVSLEDQFKKQGTAPAGVAGENWTLVHQNRARIAQIMEELNKYPVKFEDDETGDSGM